ncbi:phenylalanine--tRNA ligase subunit alpha [Candidatus Woesearchaeota archaeon]|nr:phenylalanine--tRNA ligase subunit alpha [Candidatus Woesearchaeota archaeon]MBW3006012.1 phenylalanine--tRNA ligase subunit alpha [Candidatus Woesearchaeota archaeon]
MDVKKLAEKLHPLERRVLPVLNKFKTLPQIVSATGLKDIEVMRALQWLQNKKAINIDTELKEVVTLDKNGEKYLEEQLPERRFIEKVKDKEISISRLEKNGLNKEELNTCLGTLRKKAMILIVKNKELRVKLTDQGKKFLSKEFPEEIFLKKAFPIEIKNLAPEEKHALENLKKRKSIVKVELQKIMKAELLPVGKQLIQLGVQDEKVIDALTPQMLRTGSWREKKFRHYDVKSKVPKIYCGKKQNYRRFLDGVREKFVELGFTEMKGPLVESEFWDMDALYMPQFHSARAIHDAYYVDAKPAKLDDKLVKRVKAVHENGGNTGSKGWDYEFDVKRTQNLVLRTQGTACSARMLASPDLKIPGKYFGIARCFRPDVVDATHAVDFYQTEGIIIEEGLNIRHLFSLLKMFAKEFAGAEEVKLVPGYFPFTEPSVELFAKHPEMGWIELGGAGIFRPEVVVPLLGKDVPVLAWGIGIDRIAMFKLGITDIRQLFSHDLDYLRNAKVI